MEAKILPACPVETTLTLISDKWKVLIIRDPDGYFQVPIPQYCAYFSNGFWRCMMQTQGRGTPRRVNPRRYSP